MSLPSIDQVRIGVIGLGYVGLPLAVYMARHFPVVGFDISTERIAELASGHDRTQEVTQAEFAAARGLSYSASPADLDGVNFFIVTVPTPIDEAKRPDLTPLEKASRTVGRALRHGDVVVYESTVYPGATEEVCVPILERESGLQFNRDFFAGYSPERINPGDGRHRLPDLLKITSGSTPEAAALVDAVYARVIAAGTHRASSIRVAEAAKVIENIQRDVNIALVNELAQLFKMMGLETREVLAAAGTKWNFHGYSPGLVGGHCIGVDPYYLTHKAQSIGFHPEIILAGRRINDGMAGWVAQGELPGHAQYQGRRPRARAPRLRARGRRPRSARRRGRGGGGVRHRHRAGAARRPLRRRGARREARRDRRARAGANPRPGPPRRHRLRPQGCARGGRQRRPRLTPAAAPGSAAVARLAGG